MEYLLKFNILTMKPNVLLKGVIIFLFYCIYSKEMNAQCPTGYTRDTLNWDYLDFLPNSGAYITPTAWINLAQCQAQRFAFGTQTLRITHNYSGSNVFGDDNSHTAEAGTYG